MANDTWEFYWGDEAEVDLALEMEDVFERVFGKSCVYWESEDAHLVPWRDDLETRPSEYITNGYTSDFEGWGVEMCKKGVESGVRNVDDMRKFFNSHLDT